MELVGGFDYERLRRSILQCLQQVNYRVRQYILDIYRDGLAYEASKRFSIAAGGGAEILVANPEGSGVDMYVMDIEVTASGMCFIDMYKDSTYEDIGAEIPAHSKKIGCDSAPKCKVYSGGSYTPGTKIHETLCYGGEKAFATGGQVSVGVGLIVAEGHRLHIALSNPAAEDIYASFRIIWYEE